MFVSLKIIIRAQYYNGVALIGCGRGQLTHALLTPSLHKLGSSGLTQRWGRSDRLPLTQVLSPLLATRPHSWSRTLVGITNNSTENCIPRLHNFVYIIIILRRVHSTVNKFNWISRVFSPSRIYRQTRSYTQCQMCSRDAGVINRQRMYYTVLYCIL